VTPDGTSLRGKRDYATLAILLGCGLRRAELTTLRVEDIQQREEHWVIADLVGKGGHIRTIPIPDWVKAGIDVWMTAHQSRKSLLFLGTHRALSTKRTRNLLNSGKKRLIEPWRRFGSEA
jgi:integrase